MKFNIKIYIVLFIVFTFYQNAIIAQPEAQQEIPTPPEVASLHKFIEAPVNSFTGVPSISIPLCEATEGGLTVPISVNYHASGVKVNEIASEVGIGWALNAGGVISRHVNGKPDDHPSDGYLKVSPLDIDDPNFWRNVRQGAIDTEPDIFSFSLPGYSGKFSFDEFGDIHIVPKQPLKIIYNRATNITLFTIITPDGNKYYFGLDTYNGQVYDAIDESGLQNGIDCFYQTNAWHLIRIESFDGTDVITLDYERADYKYKTPARKEFYTGSNAPITYPSDAPNLICIKESKLKTITTSTKEIIFQRNDNRQDLGLGGGLYRPKELDEIQIKTGVAPKTFEKKWVFSHDYFTDPNHASVEEGKRLRLVSLQQQAMDDSEQTNPYEFDYYKKDGNYFLPYRFDKALDYWGYYNGEIQNNNQDNYMNIPDVTINFQPCPGCKGDRNTSPEEMQYGVLTKLVHPTKGATFFSYEANRFKPNAFNTLPLGGTETISVLGDILRTCPIVDQCCGVLSDQGVHSFSADEIDNSVSIQIKLEKQLNPVDNCPSPINPSFKLRVLIPNTSTEVIAPITFNINQELQNAITSQNPPLLIEKTIPLALKMIPGLAPDTDYLFKIETEDIYGDLRFLKKTYVPDTPDGEIYVGGLRVKQIRVSEQNADAPVANDIIKNYIYSDGTLFNNYIRTAIELKGTFIKLITDFQSFQEIPKVFDGALFIEEPIINLRNLNGYHIGYEKIKEVHVGGNGSIVRKYNIELPNSGLTYGIPVPPVADFFPGELPPITLVDNGILLEEIYYAEGESVSEEMSTKNTINREYYTDIPGEAYRHKVVNIDGFKGLFTQKFNNRTKYHRLKSQTESLDGTSKITTYDYDDSERHPFPIKTSTVNSDNITYNTHFEYAFHFMESNIVYDSMVNRNMIATPIKVKVEVNEDTIGGAYQIYDFFTISGQPEGGGNDPIYPKEMYSYEMTWDANDNAIITGPIDGWDLQGTMLEYDMIVGKPKRYQKYGWEQETYTWDGTTKVMTQRKFKDFTWTYNYFQNTLLLSEIIDIDGQYTDFTYDQLMRLKSVSTRDGNNSTTYDYHFTTGSGDKSYVKTRIEFPNNLNFSDSEMDWTESWQYLDGLGRSLQTVQRQHSTDQKDVIMGAMQYDNQGRVINQFEPFVSALNSGAFVSPTAQDFTLLEYYDSPLNRLHKVTPPSWYATIYEYGSNINGLNIGGIFYEANDLTISTVRDPNNIAKIAFRDKRGRVLLAKNKQGEEEINTVTLYDFKNRVKGILPPGVSDMNSNLAYRYLYDGANNMIEKKIPDSEKNEYIYDVRDLQTGMRDGNLRNDGNWVITQYDGYGRPTKTGLHNTGGIPDGNSFLSIAGNPWTENFYDGILTNGSNRTNDIFRGKISQSNTYILDEKTTTSQFIPTIFNYDDFGRITSQNSNHHVNVLNNQTGTDKLIQNYTYDWADNIVLDHLEIKNIVANDIKNIYKRFTYDHEGRVSENYHKVGINTPETRVFAANYTVKDEISSKQLGGINNSPLQEINYTYNSQGWLTSINNNLSSSDLFHLKLYYDNPVSTMTNTVQKNGNIAQLDWQVKGDIKKAYGFEYDFLNRVKSAKYGKQQNGTYDTTEDEYGTSYNYDERGNITSLNRKGMVFNGNDWNDQSIDQLNYIHYPNSNQIQTITDGISIGGNDECPPNINISTPITTSATYTASNKLTGSNIVGGSLTVNFQAANRIELNPGFSIESEIGGRLTIQRKGCLDSSDKYAGFIQKSADIYQYDQNGNLTQDPNKQINIEYNYLNLPYKVTFGNGNVVEWLYDTDGTKLQKKVSEGGISTLVIDYIAGVEYRNNTLQAIYHTDGRVYFENDSGQYEYTLIDHLGNNRITFSDLNGNNVIESTEILQENHYYPFGMAMKGEFTANIGKSNNYLYNGKELDTDFGLNWYHYGARMYDPTIGRFTGVDPISDKFAWVSTYNYAENQPIASVDLWGLQRGVSPQVVIRPSTTIRPGATRAPMNWRNPGALNPQPLLDVMETIRKRKGGLSNLNKPMSMHGPDGPTETDPLIAFVKQNIANSIRKIGGDYTEAELSELMQREMDGEWLFPDQQEALHNWINGGSKAINRNNSEATDAQEVYEVFDIDTGEVVYVGLGAKVKGRDRKGDSLKAAKIFPGMEKRNLDVRVAGVIPEGEGARQKGKDLENEIIDKNTIDGQLPELQGKGIHDHARKHRKGLRP